MIVEERVSERERFWEGVELEVNTRDEGDLKNRMIYR
jgi:hypothetical protein